MEGTSRSCQPSPYGVPCDQSLGGILGLFSEPKTREATTMNPLSVIPHNMLHVFVNDKTSIPQPMKPMSMLEPPLSFEDNIFASASESREKEPIFYNFMPIPEIDQDQVSKEYVFATKIHEEVSTELKLGYGTCIPQKNENLIDNLSLSSTARGAKRMKFNSDEGLNDVSLELRLGFDPWVIKKRIKTSDIGRFARLFLPTESVKKYVLPLWNAEHIEKIKDGVEVGVWDCDTGSEHQLLFKQWASNGCYVFIGKWTVEFVKRRGLNKRDEIGLYWDQCNSRFSFSILKRFLSNQSSLY